jgi:hypothetical protein
MFASVTEVLSVDNTFAEPFFESMEVIPGTYLHNIKFLATMNLPPTIDIKHYLPALETIEVLARKAMVHHTGIKISSGVQLQPLSLQRAIGFLKKELSLEYIRADVKVILAFRCLHFSRNGPALLDAKLGAINVRLPTPSCCMINMT